MYAVFSCYIMYNCTLYGPTENCVYMSDQQQQSTAKLQPNYIPAAAAAAGGHYSD